LLPAQKEATCGKEHKDMDLSLLVPYFTSSVATHLDWEGRKTWKERARGTWSSVLPLSCQSDSPGGRCWHQKASCLHSKNAATRAIIVKCVIRVFQHIRVMLLLSHLKLTLHDIKMRGKIHARNLKLNFS
jgi:hypothetical protein